MSLQKLERYLFGLKTDPSVRVELTKDAEAHLARQDLEPEQRAALVSKDLPRLWRMGVHPLLLFPYAQAIGIAPPEYRRILSPLAGERHFKSGVLEP